MVLCLSRMPGLHPKFVMKVMEIKVAEINAPLN